MTKGESLEKVFSELSKDAEFQKADRAIKPRFDILKAILLRRVDLGLSQKQLAKKASTHQSRISKIESADHDIRLSTLVNIAEALDCEVCVQLIPFSDEKYQTISLTKSEIVLDKHNEVTTVLSHSYIGS